VQQFAVEVVNNVEGSVILPFLGGLKSRGYAAILSFWAGVIPPDSHVRSFIVVGPQPIGGVVLYFFNA
jgi:hypothetical protein